jgi:hypothetical protein
VLGSAGVAAFMTWRISDEVGVTAAESPQGDGVEGVLNLLPAFLQEPFSVAMSQTLLLPAFFALFGVGAALFFLGFGNPRPTVFNDGRFDDADRRHAMDYGGDEVYAVDHDEYVEYTVSWDDAEPVKANRRDIEPATEPIASPTQHLLPAPADIWHDEPFETWRHVTDEQPAVPPAPAPEHLGLLRAGDPSAPKVTDPIGLAHNGFHLDDEQRFQPVSQQPTAGPGALEVLGADGYADDAQLGAHSAGRHAGHHTGGAHERPSRHRLRDEEPDPRPFWFESASRHARDDPDDSSSHGRHSAPRRD